jgi:CRISPR-associated protein Csm5
MEGDRVPRRIAEGAESASGASQVKILSVADSDVVPTSAFKVYLTRVASLDTKGGSPRLAWKVAGRGSVAPQQIGQSTPLFAEMAAPGTSFSGRCEERSFLERTEFQRAFGWRSKPDVATIIEAANKYAAAQLQLHAQYAGTAGLTGLGHTVARLQEQLGSLDRSSCLLCLGWGGGFTSKAAVLDAEDAAYTKILRAVPAIGRSLREGVRFPKTRRIVFMGGQPAALPGWVRLQLET